MSGFGPDQGGYWATRQHTGEYSLCYPTDLASINTEYGYETYSLCSGGYWPGVCPENWKVAYTTYGIYSTSRPGTTPTSLCCPNSMSFNHNELQCQSVVSTPTPVLSRVGDSLGTVTFQGPLLTLIDFFVPIGGATQAVISETTIPRTGDARSTSIATRTRTLANADTTRVASVIAAYAAARTKGGLSSGAIAGIVTAATIVGLAVIAGIVFFILRRRRQKRRTTTLDGVFSSVVAEKRNAPDSPPSTELDSNLRMEMSGVDARFEFPNSDMAGLIELEGGKSAQSVYPKSTM